MRWSPLFTCIPQILTPRLLEVVFWHFFMNRSFLSGETSSPCWRVPIFRSRMLGWQYWAATFSNKMNSERVVKDSFYTHLISIKDWVTTTRKNAELHKNCTIYVTMYYSKARNKSHARIKGGWGKRGFWPPWKNLIHILNLPKTGLGPPLEKLSGSA